VYVIMWDWDRKALRRGAGMGVCTIVVRIKSCGYYRRDVLEEQDSPG